MPHCAGRFRASVRSRSRPNTTIFSILSLCRARRMHIACEGQICVSWVPGRVPLPSTPLNAVSLLSALHRLFHLTELCARAVHSPDAREAPIAAGLRAPARASSIWVFAHQRAVSASRLCRPFALDPDALLPAPRIDGPGCEQGRRHGLGDRCASIAARLRERLADPRSGPKSSCAWMPPKRRTP